MKLLKTRETAEKLGYEYSYFKKLRKSFEKKHQLTPHPVNSRNIKYLESDINRAIRNMRGGIDG